MKNRPLQIALFLLVAFFGMAPLNQAHAYCVEMAGRCMDLNRAPAYDVHYGQARRPSESRNELPWEELQRLQELDRLQKLDDLERQIEPMKITVAALSVGATSRLERAVRPKRSSGPVNFYQLFSSESPWGWGIMTFLTLFGVTLLFRFGKMNDNSA